MQKRTKKSIIAQLTPGLSVWVRNVDGPNATDWRHRVVVKATPTQLVLRCDDNKLSYNKWSKLLDNGQNDGGFIDHDPNISQFLEFAIIEPKDLAAVGAPMRWGVS